MMEKLGPNVYLVLGFSILVLVLLSSLLLALGSLRESAREKKVFESKLQAHLGQTSEGRTAIADLQDKYRALNRYYLVLPEVTRDLTCNMQKRKIPSILVSLADKLLAPQRILVFFKSNKADRFVLVQSRGFDFSPGPKPEVVLGRGKIGWVAFKQILMDDEDFEKESILGKGRIQEDKVLNGLVQLCAPLVFEGETLGVIAIGGLDAKIDKEAKTLLLILSNLAAVTMVNASLLAKLEELANSDGLTGLKNKAYFLKTLEREVQSSSQSGEPLSLFLFDIDHFKHYNDNHGHEEGDALLRSMGRLIRESFRHSDLMARYGGEEFVITFPRTDKRIAFQMAERFRKTVEEHLFPHQDSQPLGNLTISGGVASCPEDAAAAHDLIVAADECLYKAKRASRNLVLVAGTLIR